MSEYYVKSFHEVSEKRLPIDKTLRIKWYSNEIVLNSFVDKILLILIHFSFKNKLFDSGLSGW